MAEKIIQNPSITSGNFTIDDGKIVAIAGLPLAGSGGGTQSDFVYVPSFDNETGDITFNLGVTGTEGKGPWHISGTPGPKGEDGAQGEPGEDACPITATSAELADGVHVTISYTSGGNPLTEFDILNGYDGYSGKDGKDGNDGYSPQVTTASVNNDATHNNGGTEISITYKDDDSILTAKYTAWNGNNGEGATIALDGKDGIAISNDGFDYYAGLSADYLAAVQSVSSKLTKTSADTLYQPIGNYVSATEITDMATKTWVGNQGFVTSGDYISGTKQYALTSGGWEEITASDDYTAGTDLKIDENNVISVDTNGTANNTATNNRNFVEGSWTVTNGYNCHAEGAGTSALGYGVHAQGMWTCFSSSKWGDNEHADTDIYWAVGAGASVEGYCNATTSCPMSGTEGVDYGAIHGGIIKVIGNGYIEHDQRPDPDAHTHTHHPSDALILYRDGSLSAAGKISAAGIELGAEPDLSDYIPYSATVLPIGTSNTATNNAAAIGSANSAINLSFALGNGNSAITTGCAIGERNYAYNKSVAIGYQNTADYNVDIAIGYQNSAYDHAASLINHNIAKTYSFAVGDCNTAINYSFTLGRGLKLDNTNGGANAFGGLAIGGWNYTTADAMFVIGNGTPTSNKDYFVLKNDGSVAFGETTFAQFVGSFAEGFHTTAIGLGVRAEGAYTRFSVSNTADAAIYNWEGRGVTVEGYANATTAHPLDGNGNKIHDGVLKVIGNGGATSTGITGSDAYILYRDGTVSAKQFQNADGTESINGTTYNFTGVDNIEILPLAATANTANFPNDNVLRFILES